MELKTGIFLDEESGYYFVVRNDERWFWGNNNLHYRTVGSATVDGLDKFEIHQIESRVSWMFDKLNQQEITEDFIKGYFIGLERI